MAVVAVRWLLSLQRCRTSSRPTRASTTCPRGRRSASPAWLGWQHFFNVFLIVLIIRSGLQVRTQKRPTAFWSPRSNRRRKISLNLWFHQSLDILWLVNGALFVVLLFVTGQWMRIVPTTWEVFPNALSALLQYVSLDWPTENGWVNYNALQQIAYFATVFIAAPLAAITGVRMSGLWPKNAEALNRIPGGVGARRALPGDALLRGVHHRARRPRVRDRGAAEPQPHVRARARDPDAYAETGPASGSSSPRSS